MTAGLGWLAAFPLVQADRAVSAVLAAWQQMAATEKAEFHPKVVEPRLTRVVCAYVRERTARELGLTGFWSTEGVENRVDFATGKILQEGRTDITYCFQDGTQSVVLVFEFKKLRANADSRRQYTEGMLRFVGGLYSLKQPVAVMVGILMAPRTPSVTGLRRGLAHAPIAAYLRCCQDSDGRFVHASRLFPTQADFDTEHLRDPAKAPAHGTIRLAHVFVEFPWVVHPPPKKKWAYEDAE